MPPQDVYARSLSSLRGYPLWTPEPSNELLMERWDGFRIGDVGVVLGDGGFDVLFSICLPEDHPFHRQHDVPEGFICIRPDQLDIRTTPNAEPPGRIISTCSVTRVEPSGNTSKSDDSKRHDASAPPYRFRLSSREGALLVLPNGADRYDLLNEDVFFEQACLHGAEWYNYAVNRRRRIINSDALYLITGMHKTRSWSVAAFENITTNGHHRACFKKIEGGPNGPTYTWETTCALDWRVGPYIDHGIPNQTVFIRGFKIARRSGILGSRISVTADVPSTPVKTTGTTQSSSYFLDTLVRSLGHRRKHVFSQSTKRNNRSSEKRHESNTPNRGEYEWVHVEDTGYNSNA